MKTAQYYIKNAEKLSYFDWCRNLDTEPTPAEAKARFHFKDDPVLKFFLPEIPIYFNENKKFVMDFYSIKHLCCIEIDGEYHDSTWQQYKDHKREDRMKMTGIYTIRIPSKHLIDNPQKTLQYIKHQIRNKRYTKRERKWIRSGQPHRVVNRILKHIDHTRFNLPDSIRQRRVKQYAEYLPEFIVQFFSEHPDSISKRRKHLLTGREKAPLLTKNTQVRELHT